MCYVNGDYFVSCKWQKPKLKKFFDATGLGGKKGSSFLDNIKEKLPICSFKYGASIFIQKLQHTLNAKYAIASSCERFVGE